MAGMNRAHEGMQVEAVHEAQRPLAGQQRVRGILRPFEERDILRSRRPHQTLPRLQKPRPVPPFPRPDSLKQANAQRVQVSHSTCGWIIDLAVLFLTIKVDLPNSSVAVIPEFSGHQSILPPGFSLQNNLVIDL